ncbi:MAG: hypothetical protein DYG89_14160 [Caldilinea sp. CFX5]|nr:hypothetical protein [Caldilinea sp. CFX5]
MQANEFNLIFDPVSGGITSLKRQNDSYDTDYIRQGAMLGAVTVRYRVDQGAWQEVTTAAAGLQQQTTMSEDEQGKALTCTYDFADLHLTVEFSCRADVLAWQLQLHNPLEQAIEVGDLALPLLFNTQYIWDAVTTFTQRLIKHGLLAGHGSFLYWMRVNGVPPYLVMTPQPGTHLEYYEVPEMCQHPSWEGPYIVYIHSAVKGAGETRGDWRQPHTSRTLAPGERVTYGFNFQWAADYQGVRERLYQAGLFDVQVIPGMTLPTDLTAQIAIRTKNPIHAIVAEFPAQTTIEPLGEPGGDTHRYRLHFTRLGENRLTLHYGDGYTFPLEFFVTEPVETLIKKRTAFLVNHQQHRDPDKWYNGLFSQWDMRTAELRGPDNHDNFIGWWGYVLACDDTALPKAGFIAAKNLAYPVAAEIAAVEYYAEHFVWGKLQRTDEEEPYPYGIYGVPNWYENRHSAQGLDSGGQGQQKLWRSYDYPHIMMIYFHLYQIAKRHSGATRYLDAAGYLERAYGTAMAYFLVPYSIDYIEKDGAIWHPDRSYKEGCYNELLIPDLINALAAEGRLAQADQLRHEWEKKVKYFAYDHPYPFQSEYSFDSTAFESTHAIAKYGLAHPMQPDENLWYDKAKQCWYSHPQTSPTDFVEFMHKQIAANIACRGWIETAYYLLGSDIRGCGSSMYLLSYMAQMGGWALLDYALYYAADPFPYLRLGYNSYLSAWANMNSGTPASNYGYWYPGAANDGASGWAFHPEKYGPIWLRDGVTLLPREQGRGAWYYDGEIELGYSGALRAAATIVVDDPLFGRVALGGELVEASDAPQDAIAVLMRDGLRQRLHIVQTERKLHLWLEQDGFAAEQPIVVSAGFDRLHLPLENRTGDAHNTRLTVQGLRIGEYQLIVNGTLVGRQALVQATAADLWLSLPAAAQASVTIERIG